MAVGTEKAFIHHFGMLQKEARAGSRKACGQEKSKPEHEESYALKTEWLMAEGSHAAFDNRSLCTISTAPAHP